MKRNWRPRKRPNQRKIAEKNGYKRVSELVNFPKFFPGLGIIFVEFQSRMAKINIGF
jgi:hypothetical protein